MPSTFFGQYLLAKGLINREALIDAIQRGRRVNLMIPEIAVRDNMMDQQTADSIMTLFRTSEKSMKELCLEQGVLTEEQFQILNDRQRKEHKRIGDCLVDGEHLSRADVDLHAQAFQAQERLELQRLEANLDGLPEADVIGPCLDLVSFHFQRMSGRAAKLQDVSQAGGELRDNRRRYAQRIVGGRTFVIAIDLPDDLAKLLAQGFLGIDVGEGHSIATDAVCEFVNVVGGNVCTHMEVEGTNLRPEPPFYSGVDRPAQPTGPSICADFISEEAPFEIHLFFE